MCLHEQFLTKSFGRSSRFNHEVFTVTASAADQEIQAFLTSLHELLFGVEQPLSSSREGRKGLLDQGQATVLTKDLLPAQSLQLEISQPRPLRPKPANAIPNSETNSSTDGASAELSLLCFSESLSKSEGRSNAEQENHTDEDGVHRLILL